MTTRARNDEGMALPIALLIIGIIGVMVGVMLSYTRAGLVLTDSTTYASTQRLGVDGAAEAAITNASTAASVGQFVTPACLAVAANQVGSAPASDVTCVERATSGAPVTTGLGNTQPLQAILTQGSATGTEGVSATATANVTVTGDVVTSPRLSVATGGSLAVKGNILAGACTVTGTVRPVPSCAAAAPSDPGAAGQPNAASWALPTGTMVADATLPAGCSAYMSFLPGRYTDLATLKARTDCAGAILHFAPGVYYFDFPDANPLWNVTIASTSTMVGGTCATTAAVTCSAATPVTALATPASGASACDVNGNGVLFMFGGASRMRVSSGKVQLCGYKASGTSQRIAIAALPGTTAISFTTTTVATTGTASSSATYPTGEVPACSTNGGGGQWTNPQAAYLPASDSASTSTIGANGSCSRYLTMPFGALNATSGTVSIAHTPGGTGLVKARATFASGAAFNMTTVTCNNCAGARNDTIAVTGLSAADAAAGFTVQLWLVNNSSNPVSDVVTAVSASSSVTKSYSPTTVPPAGTAYSPATESAANPAILRADGTASLAIHGTIYAMRAAVDISLSSVSATVVDRGILARTVYLGTTRSTTFTGPVISIPGSSYKPRIILFTITVAGVPKLRVQATFATAAVDGTTVTVNQWTHL
ncbi:MAG: hypothetical protein JWM93_1380 [Frankiales bacterium]|nr:hypothetical protein [Frankiales bacterium]